MQFYLYFFNNLIKALLKASSFLWWCFLKCFKITFDFTPNYFQLLSQVNNSDKAGFSFGLEHYVDEWQRGWYKGNGIYVPIINTEYMDNEYNIEFRLGVLRYNETTYESNIKYMKTTNTLFWYNRQSAKYQYNTEGTTYYWIIF